MSDVPRYDTDVEVPTEIPPLSSDFEVSDTVYGGRGCFAVHRIPKGTVVLRCDRPIGFTITRDFKKEVCNWCFHYDNGNNMKFKILSKKLSIGFCSADCLELFQNADPDELLANTMLEIERFDIKEEETAPSSLTSDQIEGHWEEVENWDSRLPLKISKRQKFIPKTIDESVYDELKYLASVLQSLSLRSNETVYFDQLQSNELDKLIKYPQLLNTITSVFKILRLIFPMEWQGLITIGFVRDTVGREYGNAFGIWSPLLQDEYQEYLGFGLYPRASFFNHSCSPNLLKTREGSGIKFTALKDIEVGQEMFINYGSIKEPDFQIRRKLLSEWFFQCGCEQCKTDELELNASQLKL